MGGGLALGGARSWILIPASEEKNRKITKTDSSKATVAGHAYNPSTQLTKTGAWQVQSWPGEQSEFKGSQ